MAFQKFRNEQYYEAPDYSAIDRAGAVIGSMLQLRGKQKKAQRDAANQFAYDLDKGAYEADTNALKGIADTVTQRAKQELRNDGKISLETDKLMKEGLAAQRTSQNQFEREKLIRQNIVDRGSRDTYYNAQDDLDLLKDAHRSDITHATRGDILDKIESRVGGIDTFKFDKYKSEWVKQQGKESKSREYPLKSGGTQTIFDERTFWDKKTGKPGVTDTHAINFLQSEPRVTEWYDANVSRDLDQEIKAMKASGDERVSWMKGMADADIKNELINHPDKNLVNTQEYGVRLREKAKADLDEADRINSKVSYTSLQSDDNNSGGRWKNKNILHEDAMNSFAQEARDAQTGQTGTVATYGPGGRFTQKSGKAVQIDTTNPVRTDTRRGITTRNNKGSVKLNMTGYQLMPVKAGMGPFALKSNTTEGMVQEINDLPLDYFDPDGKVKLQPSMKIGLNGYTVNEAGVLNDIQDQLFKLSDEIHKAEASNDKQKLESLQNMEYNLNDLKEMVGSGDYDPQDLLLAGNKAGVRKIQQDWIIPADNSDMATIKNVTGGFDLNNKSYWSDDMLAIDEAYRKRAAEAKAQNYGKQAQTKAAPVKSTYTANGKSYTTEQLKSMGYTDDQIREAVKLGNLK